MARRLSAAPTRAATAAARVGAAVTRRAALLGVLLAAVFATVELLPGDAARSTVERGATAAEIAARRAELDLDQPLPLRFAHWLGGLATGDLGTTARGEPIARVVGEHLPPTLLLGGAALAVTLLAALALGGLAARYPGGRLDRTVTAAATVVLAVPEFVMASALVLVFALWLNLLPAVSLVGTGTGTGGGPAALVLPVTALAVPQIGWNTRLVRAALADEAAAPHVEAAVLDGLAPWRVLLRHQLPGAAPTIAAGVATSAGMLLGGAVVVETVFNYPGVGSVVAGAVNDRDTALVAGVVAPTGAVILGLLLVVDAVRAWATGRRP